MQYTPKLIYANKAAQALAEKVYEQTAVQSLDIRLKVHLDLSNRDPVMMYELISCVKGGRNFILHNDQLNYTIFMPKYRAAVQYKNGEEIVTDYQPSDERYYERIKLGLMTYDNFFEPAIVIQDGKATPLLQLQ